jgi:hypothetical protein
MRLTWISTAALLAAPIALAPQARAAEEQQKKPGLELRVTPRMGFSPIDALFTLELEGGDEHEDYYCPELEWEWGDGSRSVTESDCDPYVPGETKIDRRYTNRHLFKRSGNYNVTVRLKRVDRTVAKVSATLTVRPGIGDQYQRP